MYGAVTMNNTMCLGLFLLLVHIRGLKWDFTSEVIVTVGAPPTCALLCSWSCRLSRLVPIWARSQLALCELWL